MTKRKSSHKLREETHWKDVFFSLSDFAFIGCHNTIFSDFLKKKKTRSLSKILSRSLEKVALNR